MRTTKKLNIYYLSSLFLLASFEVKPSLAIDCLKASSPIERTICTNTNLSEKDNYITKQYQELLAKTPSNLLGALRTQQRHWVRDRDAQCRESPTLTCLLPVYTRRADEITAMLSAADTQADGVLDTLTPIILRGRWKVAPLRKEGAGKIVSDTDEASQLAEQGLPKVDDLVTATPEGLCFNNAPCEPVSWSRSSIGSMPGGLRYEQELHLHSGQVILSGRLAQKWAAPITVISTGNGDMQAVAGVCAKGGSPCWNYLQLWHVVTD